MILKILNSITNTKGTKKKVAILESHKNNIALRKVWHMTYSRMNFGTSVLVPLTVGNAEAKYSYGTIIELLDNLRCKVFTGNRAKSHIQEILKDQHPDCIEVYNRIIKGNLKCGIGFTAGAEVYGEELFKKYPVMLISSHCNKKAAKIIDTGYAILQLKGDGVRGLSECHIGGNILYYSRQGEQYQGLEKFDDQLHKLQANLLDDDGCGWRIDFDGEFCVIENGVHNPSKASGILNKCIDGTATKEDVDQLTYMVWDIIDEDIVHDDKYLSRIEGLENAIKEINPPNIIFANTWKVKTLREVHAKYAEIVKTGNEGVVLKSGLNLWKDTRVTDMIKYKEKHRAEFKILSWYKGEEGKEFQNVIGGYSIVSACGLVTSNTGSGLSYEERGILMDYSGKKPKALKDENHNYIADPDFDFEKWVDGIVSIEYNKRTQSKDGDENSWSLRFPIIKQFRNDKTTANTMDEMIEEEKSSYGLRT